MSPRRNIFYTFSSFLWLSSSGRVSIHDGLPRPPGRLSHVFIPIQPPKPRSTSRCGGRELIIHHTFSCTGSIASFHWKEKDAGRQIKGMRERQPLGKLPHPPTFFSASRRKQFNETAVYSIKPHKKKPGRTFLGPHFTSPMTPPERKKEKTQRERERQIERKASRTASRPVRGVEHRWWMGYGRGRSPAKATSLPVGPSAFGEEPSHALALQRTSIDTLACVLA